MIASPEELRQMLSRPSLPWQLLTIGDVAEVKLGYAGAKKALDEKVTEMLVPEKETVPLIQSSDLKSTKEISVTKRARKEDLEDMKNPMKVFEPGKLLLAIARSETAGRCGILNTEAIFNNAIQVLTPYDKEDQQKVHLDWLFYYFKWLDLEKYISGILSNERSAYFSKYRTKAIPIPIPPLSVQAVVLQRIDDLLQELQPAYELLSKTEQDLRDLLDPVLAKFFEPLEEDMRVPKRHLDGLISIAIRPQDVRSPMYDDYPYITPSAISPGKLHIERAELTKERDNRHTDQKSFYVLDQKNNANVLLYTLIDPQMKRIALFNDDSAICDRHNILPFTVKNSEQLHPAFLMWSLIAPPFTRFAIKHSGGGALRRINQTTLLTYPLSLPTRLIEQEAIVNQLNDITYNHIEEIRRKQAESRQSLNAVEKNILYKAFIGEL